MAENNMVCIIGRAATAPILSHTYHGVKFFQFGMDTMRSSGTIDHIPILISEKILPSLSQGERLCIHGYFHSYRKQRNFSSRHLFQVCAEQLAKDESEDFNYISLTGVLCQKPVLRTTPLGRIVCDLFIANNHGQESEYIPAIAWNENAYKASLFHKGTTIKLIGRIQSRQYIKRLNNDVYEPRVAHEVSVQKMIEL